jgi:hypothetical protein
MFDGQRARPGYEIGRMRPAMLIPSPRTGRDLFELLRLYDREAGIGSVLNRVGLADMTPRQVA